MELLVYKASAGSGKTFTLAVEYIKHLITDPRAYRRILAVTFTNKATAEMKERIIQTLYGLWTSDRASDAYLQCLRQELPGQSEEDIRLRAGEALLAMLHDYGRFRVETIDSFFQSVMRNLARELELSPNLNIELDNDKVLSEAVDSLIENLTPSSPVLTLLLNYINERIAEDKRWNVSDEVKAFARNIFNEGYVERGAMLRVKMQDSHAVTLYREVLREMSARALAEMKELAQRFYDILETHGLSSEDLKGGKNSIGGYFRKLRSGKLADKDLPMATLAKSLDQAENWATRQSSRKEDIIALARNTLIPLLEEAERRRPKAEYTVNSCTLSLRHLDKLQLLNHIDEEVRRLNHEANRFLLSDTNALLHRLMAEGDSSFIYEKIGTIVSHVMIDEFQDTSRMQWDNFRLLLSEGLAQGHDSLIVGDVKQSIYLALQEAYADVAQESPKNKQRGYVQVHFLHPENAEDYQRLTLEALGTEVRRLLNMGIRLNDIAILVRKNKNIPPIANYFDRELGLSIVSDEAFRLDASTAVCTLVDALRTLAAPEDNIARATLTMDLGLWVNQPLPDVLEQRRDELGLMPLYELLEELYTLFGLDKAEGQDAYLFAFFDAVSAYLKDHSSDLGDFIHYWDETLGAKTIPGGELDGIRIFSIHKSKGLEFHTVLIPYCDWKLENETNNQLVWCPPADQPYNQLDLVPVTYSSTMATSTYRNAYLQERLQLWVDNLNLLYVAFTRAGTNLVCWTRDGQKSTISELLTSVLPHLAEKGIGQWNEEEGLYEYGTLLPNPVCEHPSTTDTTHNRLLQKPEPMPVQMVSARPSVTFRQSNRSADFLAGVSETEASHRMIDRGRLLHTLFADIHTLNDIDPAIDRLVAEGVIAEPDTEANIRALAHRAFSLPQIQDWYSGTWRLFSECEIIWQEDGVLHTRRPDRVMVRGEEVVVVDFKFGKPDRKYNRQVQGYLNLLTRMGTAPATTHGYLWYVDEGRIEKVKC